MHGDTCTCTLFTKNNDRGAEREREGGREGGRGRERGREREREGERGEQGACINETPKGVASPLDHIAGKFGETKFGDWRILIWQILCIMAQNGGF